MSIMFEREKCLVTTEKFEKMDIFTSSGSAFTMYIGNALELLKKQIKSVQDADTRFQAET